MQSTRKRTFEILDIGEKDDRLSRIVDILLIGLISLNALSVILETLPLLQNKYQLFFESFEIASVIIFSIEYIARVWCSVENTRKEYTHPLWGRLRYMFTPMALIDLIVILPLYLGLVIDVDLRFMRVLRLLRVFKLTRYSSSMSLLLQVLTDEARSIGAALFILCMLIIMVSSLTYLAEHEAQPQAFGSIPAAMWWAIITMTGVGYGDVVPVSVMGKVLASVISIISIGIVALPAGLLASGFSEALRHRRVHYERLVGDVMEDGVITSDEKQVLKETQEILGLKVEEAKIILDTSQHKLIEKEIKKEMTEFKEELKAILDNRCPHCGNAVDWLLEKQKRGQRD